MSRRPRGAGAPGRARRASAPLALALAVALAPAPARAILDVENRGPTLDAGAFAMRITNIGSIGNPYFDIGRSFDPSFEFPRGSGSEFLKHADLWVGGVTPLGHARVSGGPLLEWRPTLDPEDRVRTAYAGTPGTQRYVDDDGDGRVDEEFLNGRDDDGDGEVDEDLGLFATQTLFAEYADDRPEAVSYTYPNGETHEPLHLDVQQQAFTWNLPGYDHVAGLRFVITNHGSEPITDAYLGLCADLDVSPADEIGGFTHNVIVPVPYSRTFHDGTSVIVPVLIPPAEPPNWFHQDCTVTEAGTLPSVQAQNPRRHDPAVAIVPLSHTTDPTAELIEQHVLGEHERPFTFGPARTSFHTYLLANDLPPGEGGVPVVDEDRYRALAGLYPTVRDSTQPHDYVLLVSAGPFPRFDPGRSLEMNLALVVAAPESLSAVIGEAVAAHRGGWLNLLPDSTLGAGGVNYNVGATGISGHETCYEPPPGLVFIADPDCRRNYIPSPVAAPEPTTVYAHGHCVWTNVDCDICTGFDGNETFSRWQDPAQVPPPPTTRARPGEHAITVEWDNLPEVMVESGRSGAPGTTFTGYDVFRLSDWRGRASAVPGPEKFQQVAAFAVDTLDGAQPLAAALDSTVAPERILYERRVYPPGRYRWTDHQVQDGFDYLYVVTAVSRRTIATAGGNAVQQRLESPLDASLDSLVTPHAAARPAPGTTWVVPNPFRAHAPWDRPPVPGDALARHLDFMGLPRARATIRIWTVAGDLVQTLVHDGGGGDGEARWDLISRNGQEVESGIYLFTVDSPLGHQVGRFVVIR